MAARKERSDGSAVLHLFGASNKKAKKAESCLSAFFEQ